MTTDVFKARERAFEAVYFAKQDAELIEKMRKEKETEQARSHLAEATGITDEAVLDKILDLGLTARNLEALSLAPIICVAWANGDLEPDERKAALEALEAEGIAKGSPSHQMFESWLASTPDPQLIEAWKDYVGGLFEQLDAPAREEVRKDVLTRAENVAKAAGGFAGIGSVSKKERDVLDEIEQAMG
ncbi:MAG: hypothetical protein GY733_12885 [bacterium]|nr:hypothetical protein [bacterium]